MSQTSIGHLFYELGLRPDKHSFETGNKLIDGTVGKIQKLVGITRNAAVAMGKITVETGAFESAELKTSVALGISTEKLDKWTAAAKIAGAKIGTITSGMSKLQTVMTNAKFTGDGLEALQKSLAPLKMDVGELLKMDVSDAYATILNKAKSMVQEGQINDQDAIVLLNQIMSAGDFYAAMVSKGMTLDSLLEEAAETQHRTKEDAEAGAKFWKELNKTKDHMESLTKLFGDSLGKELTDHVQDINKWIKEHGEQIEKGIKDVVTAIGKIVDKVVGIPDQVNKLIDDGKEAIVNAVELGNTVKEGITEGIANTKEEIVAGISTATNAVTTPIENGISYGELIVKLGKLKYENSTKAQKFWTFGQGTKLKYDDLPEDIKKQIDENGGKSNFKRYIKDGIIRPNGQVTQVAPDDWVFAARNISDLAAAFIPQQAGNYAEANNFVINQTFNIGAGGNLAQTIKSQAYNGTRDGLMQAMTQSSKRLQMMSGTR